MLSCSKRPPITWSWLSTCEWATILIIGRLAARAATFTCCSPWVYCGSRYLCSHGVISHQSSAPPCVSLGVAGTQWEAMQGGGEGTGPAQPSDRRVYRLPGCWLQTDLGRLGKTLRQQEWNLRKNGLYKKSNTAEGGRFGVRPRTMDAQINWYLFKSVEL